MAPANVSILRLVSVLMTLIQLLAAGLVLTSGLPVWAVSVLLGLGALGSAGPGVLKRFYGAYAAEDLAAGPTVRPGGTLALVLVLALAGVSSCSHQNPYLIAYRSLGTARAGLETLRDTLHQVCHLKRVACLETHGAGTAAYDTCWAQCRAAEKTWVDYLRPAANTGLLAGMTSIQLAEAAKTKPDVAAILRPLACVSGEVVKLWGHLLPPSIREEAGILAGIATGYACPKVVTP